MTETPRKSRCREQWAYVSCTVSFLRLHMKIPLLSGIPWRMFESCILLAIHFSWGSEKEKLGIYVYISFREMAIIQVVKTLTVESNVDTNMHLYWTLILSSQRFWNVQKKKTVEKENKNQTHITTFLKDRNMPNSLWHQTDTQMNDHFHKSNVCSSLSTALWASNTMSLFNIANTM